MTIRLTCLCLACLLLVACGVAPVRDGVGGATDDSAFEDIRLTRAALAGLLHESGATTGTSSLAIDNTPLLDALAFIAGPLDLEIDASNAGAVEDPVSGEFEMPRHTAVLAALCEQAGVGWIVGPGVLIIFDDDADTDDAALARDYKLPDTVRCAATAVEFHPNIHSIRARVGDTWLGMRIRLDLSMPQPGIIRAQGRPIDHVRLMEACHWLEPLG
jgi:hypothetical protein